MRRHGRCCAGAGLQGPHAAEPQESLKPPATLPAGVLAREEEAPRSAGAPQNVPKPPQRLSISEPNPHGDGTALLRSLLPARPVQGIPAEGTAGRPQTSLRRYGAVTHQQPWLRSEALGRSQDIGPRPPSSRLPHATGTGSAQVPPACLHPWGCSPRLLPHHWCRICPSGSQAGAQHTPVPPAAARAITGCEQDPSPWLPRSAKVNCHRPATRSRNPTQV